MFKINSGTEKIRSVVFDRLPVMRGKNTHAVVSIANPTAPRFFEEQPENFIIAGTV